MITEIDTKTWKHKPLGMYLLEASLITPEQLDLALQKQHDTGLQRCEKTQLTPRI